MDPVTPIAVTPTTTSNGSDFKVTNIKKLPTKFIVIIAIGIIGLIGLFIYLQSNNQDKEQAQPWNNNPKFAPTIQLATVGEQPIYGNDLNYVLYTNYPNNTFNEQQAKEVALKSVATTSAILQAAKAQNVSNVSDTLLTAPDPEARQQTADKILDQIEKDTSKFSTSIISIWYYDMDPPQISETQARQTARTKMAQLYNQIKSGTLTMQQAGDRIKADTTLARLDTNYEGNAYSENKNWTLDNPAFSFEELNQVALKLQPGQVSDLIEVISTKTMTEKFFAVIKMDDIKKGQFSSLSEWVKQATTDFPLSNQQP